MTRLNEIETDPSMVRYVNEIRTELKAAFLGHAEDCRCARLNSRDPYIVRGVALGERRFFAARALAHAARERRRAGRLLAQLRGRA
jgi:hypothetical protein